MAAAVMCCYIAGVAQPPGRMRGPWMDRMHTDTVWASWGYREADGRITGASKQKKPLSADYLRPNEKLIYYVLGYPCTASMRINVDAEKKAQPMINVKMTEVESGKTICDKTLKTTFKGGEQKVYAMQSERLRDKSWYRIEVSAQNWMALRSVNCLEIENDADSAIKVSPILMAPSVHLNGWQSTDVNAPKGESYDWAYMEVMLPKQWERKNTYVMSLGILSGYMGIQSVDDDNDGQYEHRVLFSMWDRGNTDEDKNLPDYMRSGSLDHAQDITISRFGGEGTGTKAINKQAPWQSGQWVQFLATCRPEVVVVSAKAADGSDSAIVYTNTLVSAWYKQADEKEWRYLATHRESGYNHYISSWYSFLENFTDDGGYLYRRAYYRNGYAHSLSDGRWYHFNKVGYGHTQGKATEPRYDYGHGATALYPNTFYLEQGGYTLTPRDSANTVSLEANSECVDTIKLARLYSRVQDAIRHEQSQIMNRRIAEVTEGGDKLSALKQMAAEQLENTATLGYYTDADLHNLRIAYNNGDTQDEAGLAQALSQLAQWGLPIKMGIVGKTEHIGIGHTYRIANSSGQALRANGESADWRAVRSLTDKSALWEFNRVKNNTNRFQIRNCATGLYLNLTSSPALSKEPSEVEVSGKDGRFQIKGNGRTLEVELMDVY